MSLKIKTQRNKRKTLNRTIQEIEVRKTKILHSKSKKIQINKRRSLRFNQAN